MCGIVGCILKNEENVAPILFNCISKLEYRGYDSIGLATVSDSINIKKDAGHIEEVDGKLNFKEMDGSYGIAHVRWATHGKPTKNNSHPHTDEHKNVAIVHNGIIENFDELKNDLIKEGHEFSSDTDSEVLCHLIEKFMDEGSNLENAVMKMTDLIEGAYSILAISTLEPGKIVATRKDSPLIVGLGDNGYYLASDSPAILEYAKDMMYPEKDEFVILTKDKVSIIDREGNEIKKEISTIDWSPEMAQKEGYDYFMLKEINEQPSAIKNTLFEKENILEMINQFDDINRICFVACGTSYHASITGKYLMETLVGIPTDVILASEFKYSTKTLNKQTLVIFISQSGETLDTMKALRYAKKSSKTLGIVNVVGSSLSRDADYVIYTRAGPEIGVAATKTYLSQLTCIYLLASLWAKNDDLLNELNKVPGYIEELLENSSKIEELAKIYADNSDFFFIGRGYSYPVALEGALKLKEISYIHAEGYAAGELKHGPLALIDQEIPVVVIVPPGVNYDKSISNLEEVKSRGANVIAIGSSSDDELFEKADNSFILNPDIKEIISPLVYTVPLQLFSYYVAIERQLNPDKPRNLAKCVTVE